MKRICVVGSLNVDLTIRMKRFHRPGETVIADDINTYAGGKGGNQAIAAAKLGKNVMMVGMLGEDENGCFYRKIFDESGVDAFCVGRDAAVPTGMAIIEVDDNGENRIAIVSGANRLVDNAYVDSVIERILTCDIFLMQFEISIDTVCHLAQILCAAGKTVILDPAPAASAPDKLYQNVNFLTPNATELSMLTGMPTETQQEAVQAARTLLERGTQAVIAKLGQYGCLYVDRVTAFPVPGFPVHSVDTTAAGDSFNAGFAVALADGKSIHEALVFANAVGALSTTGAGAQSSMPTLAEVKAFLGKQT